MSEKLRVGIIGATGMVGQNYIRLLVNHPWFEVVYLAASPRSTGEKYREAVAGRWQMSVEIPEQVRNIEVKDASNIESAIGECTLIFSAVNMEKQAIAALESEYASRGFAVVSNNSAHRHTDNVPVLIPEINAAHIEIIPAQQQRYGWDRGLIAVKPNCSIQSYMLPLYALLEAGYPVDKMVVTTLEALSGAGYPGPSAMDMIDNIVPYIAGEEEKSEVEPGKILGKIKDGRFVPDESISISAHCNRVPVIDGHMACVSLQFSDNKPEIEEVIEIWQDFRSVPQELELPSAPLRPLIYRPEIDRPQPRKDRDTDKGMAVSVGRLRPCNVFDYRFVGLHHNTVRGAAGGSILIAELLKAKGYLA